MAHFAGATRLDAILDPKRSVPEADLRALQAAVARRLTGEPVHRILGFREFYGLKLQLSTDTLEPRPDTEILVDAVLPFVKRRLAAFGRCDILDLGTGTGAIALALLHEAPGSTAVGVDCAVEALATAQKNAVANGLGERFSTLQSDWFASVSGKFDAIVSNPPYIETGMIAGLSREVRDFDPPAALDGGADGLAAYRKIAATADKHLAQNGLIAVEIGYDQRKAVLAIFEQEGLLEFSSHRDLGGNDRVILFQRN